MVTIIRLFLFESPFRPTKNDSEVYGIEVSRYKGNHEIKLRSVLILGFILVFYIFIKLKKLETVLFIEFA